ncbi:hypothetical protein JQV19_08425 [Sulfitobacter mediterraneus]|uniref:hypothetical protein n=1 Tax=Sulfitobacter mediterraneus TaxID=83219 RepID=UPI001939DFF1|nr:hypothetical protein [Sulfitobacter mediterraneus]MBM1556671.1 hypothetical protein [Sulfitobacter mediterraneus]MBM1570132.1 hypothetical protein [Sulfitobacter mediterraneus]MBM1574089.1 hypothetical protein [Sulfitobacter mediterraneus]MBM1577874.1 hypothetical protein [Sulfitobacter mediterraneus]MBM1579629.1 hypothetical protein [Sulfitobacter mediterraneus]
MNFLGANLTQTYTELDEGNTPSVGTVVWNENKAYKFVQYEAGAAATAGVSGEVAYYYAAGGASAGQTSIVTSDVSDSAALGAGVLQADVADGAYCWVQIKGPATLSIALTAGADGNALTAVGAGDGTLDVSGLVTDAVVAYAVDASAKIIMCDFPY